MPTPSESPAERAQRQRRRDEDGRPDRVAELAADIEGSMQVVRWNITTAYAADLERAMRGGPDDGEGVHVSGDHRPRHGRLYAR